MSLSATGPRVGESLFIAHYARGEQQSFSKSCQVIDTHANGTEFRHDCDTIGGVGGAPLIRMSDRTVVGLHYASGGQGQPRIAKRIDVIVSRSAALRRTGETDTGYRQ